MLVLLSLWPGRSAKRVFALDVPAIHVLTRGKKDVDARHEAGHDEREIFSLASEMLANEFVAAD
jgi:hypothetical protein